MELATRRPVRQARYLSLKLDSLSPFVKIRLGLGCEEPMRIGMAGSGKYLPGRSAFDKTAHVHNCHCVAYMPDDSEVVGNDDVVPSEN